METLRILSLVAVIFTMAIFISWYRRELNGDNYRQKYPHADAMLKTMSEKKVDAAAAYDLKD